jgi:hypothetical protein
MATYAADENGSNGSEKYYKTEQVTTSALPSTRFDEKAPDAAITERFGALGAALNILFSRGVEARGVERVPEDERSPRYAAYTLDYASLAHLSRSEIRGTIF